LKNKGEVKVGVIAETKTTLTVRRKKIILAKLVVN